MKVFTSGGTFQDVCCELIGMGQNRPVQRPPLSLTFCGEHVSTPQTLAVTVILPHTVTLQCLSLPYCWQWTCLYHFSVFVTALLLAVNMSVSLYSVCHCLIVGSEHVCHSNATSSDKTYCILSKLCLSHPLMCLNFHGYPRNENRREKVKIKNNFNAADGWQLAADKA